MTWSRGPLLAGQLVLTWALPRVCETIFLRPMQRSRSRGCAFVRSLERALGWGRRERLSGRRYGFRWVIRLGRTVSFEHRAIRFRRERERVARPALRLARATALYKQERRSRLFEVVQASSTKLFDSCASKFAPTLNPKRVARERSRPVSRGRRGEKHPTCDGT